MKSIRRFLVVILVAIVTLANFAAAVRGYLASMEEAEQLFNQRMLQQVDLLSYALPLHYVSSDMHQVINFSARPSDTESSLEFQWVKNDGTLLARSAAMPGNVLASLEEGFRYFNFNNYRWHVLVTASEDRQSWYILAERDDQRRRLAESMILPAVYPMVLSIPLIAFIIWWLASVGLRPITHLANELRQREATDLHSIPQQGMPVELVQLTQSTNELLRRLEASFAREKRFSGDAAHELRTPLAALKIHCENLSYELNPVPESVAKLQLGIERISHLVEQILLLNRTTPDHYVGQFSPVNLTQLVKQSMVDYSGAIAQKNHQIEFNGDECWIFGDHVALAILLNNLLDNAIKYTPHTGLIVVNTWLRGNDVVLEVMDNGCGIPASKFSRVFDRFYRLGGDRHNSQTPGCGLGLSIVQQVIELHNANIALTQSRFDHGLLVMVTFAAISVPGCNKKSDFLNNGVSHHEKNT